MTRFAVTSLIALAAFFAIGWFLRGWERWAAFSALWVIYLTLFGLGVAFIRMNFFCPAICRANAGRPRVALTFDDGPDASATPVLLDLLRRENIPAAFFCIGRKVDAHPQLAARIVRERHLIANHTYRHLPRTAMMFGGELSREISQTQSAIERATGARPRFMRPPMGHTNPHYRRVLRKLGLTMIGWDVRSMDTRQEPARVIQRVLRQARDGSIILLHDGCGADGAANTQAVTEIVDGVVKGLRARGFSFERVDRMIGN